MIEVADIFRRFADAYLAAHGAAMLPSHRRAISDILACRTEALGGHLWQCDHCSEEVFSYHSCKNRSCSKCHTADTERWLQARKLEMLPCPYFHVTVTVPEELREVLRANQCDGYPLLMKAAAQAIIDIARDPRFVGGPSVPAINPAPRLSVSVPSAASAISPALLLSAASSVINILPRSHPPPPPAPCPHPAPCLFFTPCRGSCTPLLIPRGVSHTRE
jgi:hypothetical protein